MSRRRKSAPGKLSRAACDRSSSGRGTTFIGTATPQTDNSDSDTKTSVQLRAVSSFLPTISRAVDHPSILFTSSLILRLSVTGGYLGTVTFFEKTDFSKTGAPLCSITGRRAHPAIPISKSVRSNPCKIPCLKEHPHSLLGVQ